jgi:hypothetical protein
MRVMQLNANPQVLRNLSKHVESIVCAGKPGTPCAILCIGNQSAHDRVTRQDEGYMGFANQDGR